MPAVFVMFIKFNDTFRGVIVARQSSYFDGSLSFLDINFHANLVSARHRRAHVPEHNYYSAAEVTLPPVIRDFFVYVLRLRVFVSWPILAARARHVTHTEFYAYKKSIRLYGFFFPSGWVFDGCRTALQYVPTVAASVRYISV